MSTKPRHIRREVPKDRVKFSVFVDSKLFDKANQARTQTWVEIIERVFLHVADGAEFAHEKRN